MFKCIYLASLLIFILELQHGCTSISIKKATSHICSKIERYTEEIIDTYNETFMEPYSVLCFNFPPKCTRYREAVREKNTTIYIPKTRTVFKCCDGYVMKNEECLGICPFGCVHGKCIKPHTCICDEGWQGPDCSDECHDGWYGEGCQMYCSCQNGATCDKKNGFCHCQPGFVGTFCESVSPKESYGKKCGNVGHCHNGGVCNFKESKCECPPGYIGRLCDKQCEVDTYGDKCLSNCTCNDLATVFCSHIDGKCFCVPGWKGDTCFSKCDLNTWGPQCSKKCECPPNSECDHINGNCSCQPGWQGLLCDKKCEEGYFGKDCKRKCPDCMFQPGSCHYITGQCSCPAGSRGSNCDLACPENTFGENCNYNCSCSNNSLCDTEDGTCTCLPGWIGTNCSKPCASGMYGLNCSFNCNCSDNCTCNPVDGKCSCQDYDCTECTHQGYNKVGTKPEDDESDSSWYLFMVLFIACVLLGLVTFISFGICLTKKTKKNSSSLRKEENSTTNVMEDNSSPSISSYHFMNPNYETIENTDTLKQNSIPTFSSANNFTVTETDRKLQFQDDFRIPDCDTALPIENQRAEIVFQYMLKKEGEKDEVHSPEIRYSKKAEPHAISTDCVTSETNSFYADVEYKNEDYSKMSEDPPRKEE